MPVAQRLAIAVYSVVALLGARVEAQEIQLMGPLNSAPMAGLSSEPASKSSNSLILPTGHLELGGELALVTCDECPLLEDSAKLTDIALFRGLLRHSLGERLELIAGTSLLAKQPEPFDAAVWQGSSLGLRVAFAEVFASEAVAAVGPLLGRDGTYGQLGTGLRTKLKADSALRFELALGGLFTSLGREDAEGLHWIEELTGHFETQFGERGGGGWVGIGYAVPVAHSELLDPGPRLDLDVGGVVTFDAWDLYAIYTIVDRGDVSRPESTLPILDGGFDQHRVTLGVRHRFEPARDDQ
jgi:hypothetical protein